MNRHQVPPCKVTSTMLHASESKLICGRQLSGKRLCAKHRPFRPGHRLARRCVCQQDTKEKGAAGTPKDGCTPTYPMLSTLMAIIPSLAGTSSSPNGEPSGGPSPGLGNPVQTVVWGGRLPSRRRAITGGLSALGIGPIALAPLSCPHAWHNMHGRC